MLSSADVSGNSSSGPTPNPAALLLLMLAFALMLLLTPLDVVGAEALGAATPGAVVLEGEDCAALWLACVYGVV